MDGVALLAAEIETGPIEALLHNRVPLVTMDRRIVSRGLSDVSNNYVSGMREAVKHLKQLRHRKIAYIGGTAGLTISEHRVDAFTQAMREAGLKVNPDYLRVGDYRITGGESGMAELLALKGPPTAVVAANDLTAIGALRLMHRQRVNVPGEISVVGFDDIALSDIVYPPLTTIRLPRPELATLFVDALDAFRKDPHAVGKQYIVNTSLVIREPTGPARPLR